MGYIKDGSVALLTKNGFSVFRSSVPRSRNAVDITIEQANNTHVLTSLREVKLAETNLYGFKENESKRK